MKTANFNETTRLKALIKTLLNEREKVVNENELAYTFNTFRSLVNTRHPMPVADSFLEMQDELLQSLIRNKGITDLTNLIPIEDNLYLWQGDITTLKVDAIVNAANHQLLGCFYPCHGCIDNAIHTYAGVQLRLACAKLMEKQNQIEVTGSAKITSAYNLPSKYVIHTVGPIITGEVTERDCTQLAACYRSCLQLADASELASIAFCCISTGEYRFPNETAAEIAVNTVRDYINETGSRIKVIFNVFKKIDYDYYEALLK